MENVVLVIHLFLALAIIGLVLIQRSEGGGLGIGGGGGGMGRLASPKGTASLLSRATGICAMAFFATSLLLGIMAARQGAATQGLLDTLNDSPVTAGAPASTDGQTETSQPPRSPEIPAAPLDQ